MRWNFGVQPGESRRRLLQIATLATLYVATGRLGLSVAHYQDNATLIWPPTGLALAALILYGRRLWPGVALGALILNVAIGTAWSTSIGIALGNTLEAVVGAFLLERATGFRPSLSRVRDVAAFLLIGAVGSTLVSPAVGVTALYLGGELGNSAVGLVFLIWWLGDVGGAVVFAPILLVAVNGSPDWASLGKRSESWMVLVCLIVSGLIGFTGLTDGAWALLAAFSTFPFLVWAGARLGPRGAVAASGMTTVIATVGTTLGVGPFVVANTHTSLMLLWAYGMSLGATALTLAASIAERELAERQRREEEQSRSRLERRMQETQRLESLGVLAGGVAHDFNNILFVIRGNAELLDLKGDIGTDTRNMLREVMGATDRAADLCRQLLSYTGRRETSKEPVMLHDVISETMSMLGAAVSKKVTFSMSADADRFAVDADKTLLRQVLMNLVLNGAEAIEDQTGTVTVKTGTTDLDEVDLHRMSEASTASPGGFVFVEVLDDGCGMDQATRERMFDPFFTNKFTGRGLGLAAVLGIMRTHDGAIDVKSAPGFGTTVCVYLPRSTSVKSIEETEPESRSAGGAGQVVLVADDEASVLAVVTQMLECSGFRVLSARNGQEAVEQFRAHRPEIAAALLDITMPVMSGLEALKEIRDTAPSIPVLLMSGYESEAAAARVGPDAFIRKPVSMERLIEPLQHAIAQAESRSKDVAYGT